MAAFTGTPVKSPIYTEQDNDKLANHEDARGGLECAWSGVYTHTATEGSGTGEVNLVKLPPGKLRVLTDLCRLVTTAFATSADLHIGHRAYTGGDGVAVVEDDNSLADNLDAGGGALDQTLPLPAAGYQEYDSQDGVLIYAMIDTGNIEATDTISLFVVYQRVR